MLVHIFVTNNCNLNCEYCYVSDLKKKKNFTTDSVEDLIVFVNKAIALNKSERITLDFFGGEPLLNKRVIEEIIKKARVRIPIKQSYMMTTNGTLLTTQYVDFLAEHHFLLSLSLDGIPEQHNKQRKYEDGSPSWETISRNIEYVLKKIPTVTARMTFNAESVSNLYENVQFIVQQGFKVIKPVPDFFDSRWDEDSFSILREQFRKIQDYANEIEDVQISLFKKELVIQGDCTGGYDTFSIDANGDIYPCNYIVGTEMFRLGNIHHIEDFELTRFHTDHSQRVECTKCSYFITCTSARCIFTNYKMTKNLCKPNGFFCAFERLQSSYVMV